MDRSVTTAHPRPRRWQAIRRIAPAASVLIGLAAACGDTTVATDEGTRPDSVTEQGSDWHLYQLADDIAGYSAARNGSDRHLNQLADDIAGYSAARNGSDRHLNQLADDIAGYSATSR
jgi:hypothetical protein